MQITTKFKVLEEVYCLQSGNLDGPYYINHISIRVGRYGGIYIVYYLYCRGGSWRENELLTPKQAKNWIEKQ